MDRVLLIHSGVAESWTQMHDGQKDNVWLYTGRGAADGTLHGILEDDVFGLAQLVE